MEVEFTINSDGYSTSMKLGLTPILLCAISILSTKA